MSAPAVPNLRIFLDILRTERQVVEVTAPVDADQEIAEIHRRVIAAKGPALLFTNVKGADFPVVTNLFGSAKRVELAFGSRPGEFVREVAHFVHHEMPPPLTKLWKARHLGLQGLRIGMKRQRRAEVCEVVEAPALGRVPLLKLWPEDGGHFMTLPLVYTESPVDGKPNLGMYRIQRYDDRHTGLHCQIGKGGGFHYQEAEERGEALPVTIFAGGPPALILSAIAPLPEGVPELLLASLLLGKRLPYERVPGWPHPIIAECEFAFAGHALPKKRKMEGPFGDHYGYYSLKHPYPVFRCKKVYRRKDAIWPATVVGKPRQEDFYIGDYLQELLSPIFPIVMPTVRDLWSYGETGFHSLAAAVVKERYEREAMASAFRILGEGQLSLTKFLLATDSPVDLKDFPKTLQHILERTNFETDLFVFANLSMDTLDYAGPEVNKGSKGVLLGLGASKRDLPREFTGEAPAGVRDVRVFCPGCLVVGGPSYEEDAEFPKRLASDPAIEGWQLVVLCDRPAQAAASSFNFLWTAFTRFEPAADLHAARTRLVRNHVAFSGPLVLDARMKPWYPKEVFADRAVANVVDERWKEYFPDGKVEMGSSDLGDLTGDSPA
jgi:UbiD family decarboxylase